MDNHNNKSVDSTWTQHDRSMFLHAVANDPDDIAGRWDEMANAIPGKTPEEVKAYYEAVEHDLLELKRVGLSYRITVMILVMSLLLR
ncbi:putative transcription factor MYB-HB-like family [Helianthus annuus]|nr:putative transcription factor MYB-HB-like family [Helianthus annuus]